MWNWAEIIKYHIRWQSGIIVSFPVFYIAYNWIHMNTVFAIIFFQFVGACVYYPIDKGLFSTNNIFQKIKNQINQWVKK